MTKSSNKIPCPRCGVGQCELTTTTFVDVIAGQLLSVPNMAVYTCDICHFSEFEQTALDSLLDKMDADDFRDELQSSMAQRHLSSYDD